LVRKINKLEIKDGFNKLFFQIKGLKLRIAVNEKMNQAIEGRNFHGIKFTEIK